MNEEKLPRILPSSAIAALITYVIHMIFILWIVTNIEEDLIIFGMMVSFIVHMIFWFVTGRAIIEVEYDHYGQIRSTTIPKTPDKVAIKLYHKKDKFKFIEWLYIPRWIEALRDGAKSYINSRL